MQIALQPTAQADLPTPMTIALGEFVADFGESLLGAVREQNPPVYNDNPNVARSRTMDSLLRKPFAPQRDVVQAVSALLCDHGDPAAIVNAEMGTGKTMMAIAAAAVIYAEAPEYARTLVISPPHLV